MGSQTRVALLMVNIGNKMSFEKAARPLFQGMQILDEMQNVLFFGHSNRSLLWEVEHSYNT